MVKAPWKLLAAACVLVIGIYAYTAPLGRRESLTLKPADTYYNLLVRGFRAGQLSLKKTLPPGFASLADPYDPSVSSIYQIPPYRLSDLSYYKGRIYLYFGVTPALVLFWPFSLLTGHYLPDRLALVIICAVGFLASVGLLWAIWRRCFAGVRPGVVAAGALALGLATGVPVLFPRSGVHELAIGCGYMLTMLTLAAVWRAMAESRNRSGWLALASVAYGLAVGARPTVLFGAVVLLAPVAQSWREGRSSWRLLLAAIVPITLIGLGLALYNYLRFGNPFEFGTHYQLSGQRQLARDFFSPGYLWFNFRVYFLQPAHWSGRFPFVQEITVPPLPAGYTTVDIPFGILANIPLVWLALAVPLAWRGQPGPNASILRWFALAVALMFGCCALTLSCFESSAIRYQVDFLPALVLLAVVGIFGVERAVADRPTRRRAARCGWGLLLAFSVAFNLLVSIRDYAPVACQLGTVLATAGHVPEAIHILDVALEINPDYAEAHNNLGNALLQDGNVSGAIDQYQQAVRSKPDYTEAYYNLGNALQQSGRLLEAIDQYLLALRFNPDYAEAHNDLGNAFLQVGNVAGAIDQYQQAVRVKPGYAAAHYNLGNALVATGRLQDAIDQYQQAVRIKPDYAEALGNLGNALLRAGNVEEAIGYLRDALRLQPNSADTHINLGNALLRAGHVEEAIGHFHEALRLMPDSAVAHYNLGNALLQSGRTPEAIEQYQQALRIKPDFIQARNKLERLQTAP